jgi:alanine-synthesizing transaminase
MIAMSMKFSTRTAWDTRETELALTLSALLNSGLPLLDLTASNPTQCGFVYDEPAILSALAQPKTLTYDPNPRGMPTARQAVVAYYANHGVDPNVEDIILTTSTSEAYSYLFRLLCDPGDEVLIAQPSYPLFDFLAQLEDVRLIPYPLFYDHGWHLDTAALRAQISSRTRAIALVHPNNPTGHFTKDTERRELEAICTEHNLALIVDEVFLDYGIAGHLGRSFASGEHPVLTFVLSGLSKIAALPQMKAAWIATFGPRQEMSRALDRLEVIADTFLSMNAPIQWALPSWLAGRGKLQSQISNRLEQNLNTLDRFLVRQKMVSRLEVEAGWYSVLRVPAVVAGDELAINLIRDRRVSVHPGHFFGFPGDGWLVISLLPPEAQFSSGIDAILNHFCENDPEPKE